MNPIIYTGFKASMFISKNELHTNFFNINTNEFVAINFGPATTTQAKKIKKALSGNFVIIDTMPASTVIKRYLIRTQYNTYDIAQSPENYNYRIKNLLSLNKKLISCIGLAAVSFIAAACIPEYSHLATVSNFLSTIFNPIALCFYGMAGAEFFFYRDERNALKDIFKKAFSKTSTKENKSISDSQWMDSLDDLKRISNITEAQRERIYAAINHSDLSPIMKEEYKHFIGSQDKLSYKFIANLESNYHREIKRKTENLLRG